MMFVPLTRGEFSGAADAVETVRGVVRKIREN
jgi:hypothetical protein